MDSLHELSSVISGFSTPLKSTHGWPHVLPPPRPLREDSTMNVDNLSPDNDTAGYALALAEILERNEETTLGPTDSEFLAKAARAFATTCKAKR
jgi:hypothetical protein